MGVAFDYERAWLEVAVPGWHLLPEALRYLYERTARETQGIVQNHDLSLDFPNDDLKREFHRAIGDGLPLGLASNVVYYLGHWYPGSGADHLVMPGREHGAHWKFSMLADRALRRNLGIEGDEYCEGPRLSLSLRLHQGIIRIACNTRQSSQSVDVAPGSWAGADYARQKLSLLQDVTRGRTGSDLETRVYRWCEAQRTDPRAGTQWDEDGGVWRAWASVTTRYQYDESERITVARKPEQLARLREEIEAKRDREVGSAQEEARGKLWLLDRGCVLENAIYYAHSGEWCFGWCRPLTDAAISQWLDILTEFPYPYKIKGYEGYRERLSVTGKLL